MISEHDVLRIYGTDYKAMTVFLLEEADLAQRIPGGNARIAIKPNLVLPSPAEFGATTHPEIVEGILLYLLKHGFHNLSIVEGSWIGDRTAEAFEYCGYNALAARYGIRLIDTQKEACSMLDCAGVSFEIASCAAEFDFLINVPVLKGHCQTHMTCALKNLKGLLSNREKRHFHALSLHDPIARLNARVRPDFIVCDHICGDPDFEEGGHPLERNCVMAALDPVLLDTYAARLLGFGAEEIPYIKKAEALGIGTSDLSLLSLRTLYPSENNPETAALRRSLAAADLPREKKLLHVSYPVEDADSCSACYASLLEAFDLLAEEGVTLSFSCPIGIGQGHKGKHGYLGIGNCCAGFDHFIPGCPPDAKAIIKGLKAVSDLHSGPKSTTVS